MWTLVQWVDQDKNRLYLLETEKLKPYEKIRGKIINAGDKPLSEEEADTIEHLSFMLGEQSCTRPEGIPTLEAFLAEADRDRSKAADCQDLDKESMGLTNEEREERKKGAHPAPWACCKLTGAMRIDRYVNNVFVTGFYT